MRTENEFIEYRRVEARVNDRCGYNASIFPWRVEGTTMFLRIPEVFPFKMAAVAGKRSMLLYNLCSLFLAIQRVIYGVPRYFFHSWGHSIPEFSLFYVRGA